MHMTQHRLPNGLTLADGRTISWTNIEPGVYELAATGCEPTAVAYARTATRDHSEDGGSLRRQVECALEVAAQNEEQVVAVYLDSGVNAAKTRVGLQQLLQDIRRKSVRTLYTYRNYQLYRMSADEDEFLDAFGQYGMQVVSRCTDEPPIGLPLGPYGEALLFAAHALHSSRVNNAGRVQ